MNLCMMFSGIFVVLHANGSETCNRFQKGISGLDKGKTPY
ncbi:hypothetical protein BN1221_04182 [Brenneria goodwinii]|uniref:Uncharacterized protein n=1 Tax=Brenneria goodwinii TaxID=1109412 RepID=A0A0G4K0I2_9GAMM|nr:hypothetical protein BN1221_04182 [Brenneria goodwinii]